MFKNISFLTAAAFAGISLTSSACILSLGDDSSTDDVGTEDTTTDGTETGTDDGTDSTDSTDSTDGTDDDVGTEGTDGDTEGTDGTDDGTDTGVLPLCGWSDADEDKFYGCGFEGEDPGGMPIGCPEGLVEGDPCGNLTGPGCCDADGNNWYCGEGDITVFEAC